MTIIVNTDKLIKLLAPAACDYEGADGKWKYGITIEQALQLMVQSFDESEGSWARDIGSGKVALARLEREMESK